MLDRREAEASQVKEKGNDCGALPPPTLWVPIIAAAGTTALAIEMAVINKLRPFDH